VALRYKTVWYATATPERASQTVTLSLPQFVMRNPETGKSLVAAVILYSATPVISAGANVAVIPHIMVRRGDSAAPDATLSVNLGAGMCWPTGTARALAQMPVPATAAIVSLSSTLTLNLSVRLQVNGQAAMNNHCAMLGVTYKYDDTSPRQVKTAILPIHPEVNSIPTTEGRLGVIPQLQGAGGALPETSASVIHGFLSILASSYRQASTGDFQLHLRADGTASYSFSLQMVAGADYAVHYVWPLAPYGLDQSTEAVVYAYVTGSVNHALWPQVLAFLTYDFEISAATRVLCHAEIPFQVAVPQFSADSTAAIPFHYEIPEGGAISLGRSAVLATFAPNTAANTNLSILAGNQTVDARTYSWSSQSQVDYKTLHHPIDRSSSFSAADLSFSYGVHYISDFFRVSNVSAYANLTGVFHLNYIADTPSAGVGAATQVVWLPQATEALTATERFLTLAGLPSALSDYWAHAAFLRYGMLGGSARAMWSHDLYLSATAAEARPAGFMAPARQARAWSMLGRTAGAAGYEAIRPASMLPAPHPKRHQHDPDPTRLSLHMSRRLRTVHIGNVAEASLIEHLNLVVCYHAVTHTADRVLTGYSGTGDGINVTTYRADTGERVWECSSSGAGLYRTRYYWRGYKLFDEARQDDSHVGRSNDYSL